MNDCLYLYDAHHPEKSYPRIKEIKEKAGKMAYDLWRAPRVDG